MSVLVEFSAAPSGKSVSLGPVIAEVMKIIREYGVSYRANPMVQ